MSSSVMKNFRHVLLPSMQIYGIVILSAAVYSVLMNIVGSISTLNALQSMIGMVVIFSIISLFAITSSMYVAYFALALSYGGTRKGFIGGMQVCKLVISLIETIIITLAIYIIAAEGIELPVSVIAVVFVSTWLFMGQGEIMGALVTRYGGLWGIISIILTMLAFGIIGGIVGYSAASGTLPQVNLIIEWFVANITSGMWLASGIIAVICIVQVVLVKKILSKSAVRI